MFDKALVARVAPFEGPAGLALDAQCCELVSYTFVLRHVYVNCTYKVRNCHYMCKTGASIMHATVETH